MQKKYIRFNLLPPDKQKKQKFLRDANTDFTVILGNKTFQLHKYLLIQSEFFLDIIKENRQTVFIQCHLNVESFQKILGCFYGIQALFERHNIVNYILKILSVLKVKSLNDQLQNDMRKQSQQYGLFNLFYLARILGMKDVQQKCLKDLIQQQFEQINYNRYDLFQLNPQLFIFILKQHQKLKANRSITGLSANQMRLVCQEYSKSSGVVVSGDQILDYGKELQIQAQIDSGSENNDSSYIRRRNATWANMIKQDFGKKKKDQKTQSSAHQQKIFAFRYRKSQPTNNCTSHQLAKICQNNKNHKKIPSQIRSVGSAMDRKEQQMFINGDGADQHVDKSQKGSHKDIVTQKKPQKKDTYQGSENSSQSYKLKPKFHELQKQEKRKQKSAMGFTSFAVLKKNSDVYSDSNEQY